MWPTVTDEAAPVTDVPRPTARLRPELATSELMPPMGNSAGNGNISRRGTLRKHFGDLGRPEKAFGNNSRNTAGSRIVSERDLVAQKWRIRVR